MRAGAIIYPILSTYTGLTDLVESQQMFAVRAQQPTALPYIVYREISSIPTNTNGPEASPDTNDPKTSYRSTLDITKVQITAFADDYLSVENIAVKIRQALDRAWGSVPSPYDNEIYADSIIYDSCTDDFDDDFGNEGVYMKHLEFTIRVHRLIVSN